MIEQLIVGTNLSPTVFFSLTFLSGLTSLISAVFGVGGGSLLLGVMTLWLSPAALIPVHGVVQLGSNSFRVLLLFKRLETSVVLPFVAGSLAGSVASGTLLLQLPGWVIQLAIAIFLFYTVLGKMPSFGKHGALIAGGFSGFLTMMIGATGPFVSGFVKNLNLAPATHVATSALLMTFQHLLKLLVFGILGFSFAPYLPLIVAMLVAGFTGTWVGKRILLQMPVERFRLFLNAVLLLLAVRLVAVAAIDFIG